MELLIWLAARAVVDGPACKSHGNHHIPISNTVEGMMALEALAGESKGNRAGPAVTDSHPFNRRPVCHAVSWKFF